MKKIISLFILVIYMASAIGFTYSLHYCGGKFKEVCFTSDTEKNCCGKDEKQGKCCSNKVISAKFKSDQNSSAKSIILKLLTFNLHTLPDYFFKSIVKKEVFANCIVKWQPPPLIISVPIYLRNRVLRV